MGNSLFTPEELSELASFDAEIDESDITQDEIDASRARDREAVLAGMNKRDRKIAEAQRTYYEANREKIAEAKRAYREANREKRNAYMRAYREANREKWNAYMREYRRRRKERGTAQVEHHHPDSAGRV